MNGSVPLIDEVRMDRTRLEKTTVTAASGDKEYLRSKSMQERLAALELMRQVLNAHDPDTTPFQRVLEVTRRV